MALSTFSKMIQDAGATYHSAKSTLTRDNIVKALGEVIPVGWAVVIAGTTPYFNDGSPCRFGFEEAALVRMDEGRELNGAFVGERAEDIFGVEQGVLNLCDCVPYASGESQVPDLTTEEVQAVHDTFYAISDDNVLQSAFGGNFRIAILAGGEIKKFNHDRGY